MLTLTHAYAIQTNSGLRVAPCILLEGGPGRSLWGLGVGLPDCLAGCGVTTGVLANSYPVYMQSARQAADVEVTPGPSDGVLGAKCFSFRHQSASIFFSPAKIERAHPRAFY
jgi:hypothetical protein